MSTLSKRLPALLFVAFLAACGDPGGGGQTPKFSLSVFPASIDAFQASRTLVEVRLTRSGGFTDDVEVGLEAPPDGVSSSTLTFPEGLTTTLLELSVNSAVEVGSVLKLNVQGVSGAAKTTTALQLTVKPPAPSSQELIQQALETGVIDYGASLLYRAYAIFGDPALPEAFVGSGSEAEDIGLFVEAQEATLSADIQAKLEPFLVRPADPRSIFNAPSAQAVRVQNESRSCKDLPPLEWITKESATTPFRVWVQCNSSVTLPPERYLDEALKVIEKAYGPMTRLMGEPILDGGTLDEGGDPNLDIYLSPYVVRAGQETLVRTAGAHTVPAAPFQGNKSSGYIQLPEWRVFTSDFRPFLLHEFFHLLQFAHNKNILFQNSEEWWFTETSATWASIHFDRTLWPGERSTHNELWRFPNSFQNKLESLHVSEPTLHMYAAYIWPYFVEQETDGPAFMGAMWRGLESATTFEGGNNVLDSVFDFKDNFHTFAVRNLGYYDYFGSVFPERKRYTSLDPLFPSGASAMPRYRRDITLNEAAKRLEVPVTLPALSADYLRFLVNTTKVRKVTFDFSSGLSRDHLDIDALINYKSGGWKLETMTADELTLCFDKPDEEADDLWFVMSNHSRRFSDVIAGALIVTTYALCEDGWVGTSESIINAFTPIYEISASVTWRYSEALSVPELGDYVYLPEGTVSFRDISGSGCTISPSSYPVTNENGGELRIDYSTDPPSYQGAGVTLWEATYTCPHLDPFTAGAGGGWFLGEGTLEDEGATIQGTQGSSGQTFTFRFTRQ